MTTLKITGIGQFLILPQCFLNYFHFCSSLQSFAVDILYKGKGCGDKGVCQIQRRPSFKYVVSLS